MILSKALLVVFLISALTMGAQRSRHPLFYSVDCGTTVSADLGAAFRTGVSVYGYHRHKADISALFIPGYGSPGFSAGAELGYYWHVRAYQSKPLNYLAGVSVNYLNSRQVSQYNTITNTFLHRETRYADIRLGAGMAWHFNCFRIDFLAQFMPFISQQKFHDRQTAPGNGNYSRTVIHTPGSYLGVFPFAAKAGISLFLH